MNLNHVHLGTKNLKQSQSFYEKYFGFRKKFDHGEGVFLVNSSHFLIAIDPVEVLPTFPEWYHLGFCLDSETKVLEIYEKMKIAGENIVREMKRSSNEYASFFVKDPDGNKIEVSWHNE
jgi:catechol 2,3-dioxygenase-like lactoylglutathione lyase family enzyme